MEIKNNLINTLDPYRVRMDPKAEAAGPRARSAGEEQAASAQGDRVSLSPSALLHTLAHSEAARAPEVRQEKVDALKEQVATGEYVIDPRKIAGRLLENETLLAATLSGE